MRILVTGGAGFIGSAVVRHLIDHTDHHVINLDKLSYAGNLQALAEISNHPRYCFEQHDICDRAAVDAIFARHQPDALMHLAAQTHVDRSITDPAAFIETNVTGTYTLLEAARQYRDGLDAPRKAAFRFHHVSTDEVYGDLHGSKALFTETTPYAPSSPYSASKAASDHLVRAWHRTYGLPVVLSNCSNNYGPWQFPEKLIPLTILNALAGKPLPVYGQGQQIRDWLYVEDHARALVTVLMRGQIGQTWNIGGHNEKQNIEVVRTICGILEELAPENAHAKSAHNPQGFTGLVRFVTDRAGHDQRYAIDAGKIQRELGWQPQETFETGLRKTVQWYLANPLAFHNHAAQNAA